MTEELRFINTQANPLFRVWITSVHETEVPSCRLGIFPYFLLSPFVLQMVHIKLRGSVLYSAASSISFIKTEGEITGPCNNRGKYDR
jgi:hypothetical protein